MYLVEIEAGREELFHSVESLASAIRRGEVGPDSRIFHRASSSWVSVTVHPEYRKAAADRATEPLPPLARKQWTFYGMAPKVREIDDPAATPEKVATTPAEPGEHGGLRRGGLRSLFGRVFRSLSATPNSSELADT
jgi:hypothetical protein